MNQYQELKERHQKELGEFPIHYAFNDEQFKKALEEMNVKEEEISERLTRTSAGGFMLKEDYPKYKEMLEKQSKEVREAINQDKDGSGFIKDMFISELANHEYGYTNDPEETLEALNITYEDLQANPNLNQGLMLSIKNFEKNDKTSLEQAVESNIDYKEKTLEALEEGSLSYEDFAIACTKWMPDDEFKEFIKANEYDEIINLEAEEIEEDQEHMR